MDYYISNYGYANSDYLEHYGVLGMKWGVRKDKQYRTDMARYDRNMKIRTARKKMYGESIDRSEYRKRKKQIVESYKEKKKAIKNDSKYKTMTPKSGAKIRDIYKQSKQQAVNKIPNYTYKRRNRIAANAMAGGLAATFAALAPVTSGVSLVPAIEYALAIPINEIGYTKNMHLNEFTIASGADTDRKYDR